MTGLLLALANLDAWIGLEWRRALASLDGWCHPTKANLSDPRPQAVSHALALLGPNAPTTQSSASKPIHYGQRANVRIKIDISMNQY